MNDWIKDVIYMLPIAGLIWKASTQASQIKQNTKDIENLKAESENNQKQILSSLQNMNQIMSQLKTDVEIIKALRKEEVEKIK